MNTKKNLSDEVVEYLKLKHRREIVRKSFKKYYDKKKIEGIPIRTEIKYYPENDRAFKYKQNAILAVKRLFGNTHLI